MPHSSKWQSLKMVYRREQYISIILPQQYFPIGATDLLSQGATAVVRGCSIPALGQNWVKFCMLEEG